MVTEKELGRNDHVLMDSPVLFRKHRNKFIEAKSFPFSEAKLFSFVLFFRGFLEGLRFFTIYIKWNGHQKVFPRIGVS